MEEVLSTIFAGCRVAIASSHLFMTFMIFFYLIVSTYFPVCSSMAAADCPTNLSSRNRDVSFEAVFFLIKGLDFSPSRVSSLIGQLARKGDSLSILASQVLEMFVRRLVLRVNHPDTASVHQLGC